MSEVTFCFKNKISIVTGAGRGIGRAIAIALANSGSITYALSKTLENLQTLQNESPNIRIKCVDVSDWLKVNEVINEIGTIDFLVNNAGIASLQHCLEIDEESFDKMISINVKSAINISQLVATKALNAKRKCSIVNISSQASMRALDNHLAYCASKAALDQVTRVMAKELSQHNIRVNAVNPTVVLTDMSRNIWNDANPQTKEMLSRIPIGRFAEQAEIVAPVLFLLSEAASMITGVTLPIDGGFTIS